MSDARPDPAAALAALRALGPAQVDPVRLRFAEALARRAAAHDGEVRRLLDDRLAQALAACRRPAGAGGAAAPAAPAAPPPASRPGPLAELLAHIARQGAEGDDGDGADAKGRPAPASQGLASSGGAAASSGGAGSPAGLKAVRQHQRTWARLGVDQRVSQSRARVPDNAGPLNTQRLLHQALAALRDTSPDYLRRLVAQVEALLWLEQASQPPAPVKKPAPPRAGRERKGVAGARVSPRC